MEKKIAAGLSIFSNTTIIILKIIAGIVSGSISIISEAIHSMSDFLASVLTFFAVSRSSEPADTDHPFGHGKYEDMAGFIEGVLIVLAGIYIICEALKKAIVGYEIEINSLLGIYVMSFAVIANMFVSKYLFHVAKKTDSVSLYADGEHLRTDVWSSLGVLIGLVIIKFTGLVILDSVIAIAVALVIINAGFSISKKTLNNLLDGALPKEDIEIIENVIKSHLQIKGFKNLRARKSGHNREVEVTLFFEAEMSILSCHNICDEIEENIKEKLPNVSIAIHLEPYVICEEKV